MDNVDLTQVVDAVSSKIGLAADALAPITETLVRETAAKYELLAHWNAICVVVMILVFVFVAIKFCIVAGKATESDNHAPAAVLLGIVSALLLILIAASVSHLFDYAAKAVSPTLTLLENVLK